MATPLGGEIGAWSPTLTGDSTDWIGAADGIDSGGVTIVRERGAGGFQAWDLNGSTGQIDATIGLTSGDVTISGWLNADDNTQRQVITFSEDGTFTVGKSFIDFLILANGKVRANLQDASGLVALNEAEQVFIGEWLHFAVVCSSAGGTMYINAVVKSENATAMAVSGLQLVSIGGAGYEQPNLYDGKLDDLRIFNRALVPAEIQALASKRGYQR